MDEAKKMVPSKVVPLGPRPGSLPKPSQASTKAVAPKPAIRGSAGKATEKAAEKIAEDAQPQDLEAKLTREIEAKLRRELETKLAREIEARLMQELEAKLAKAAKESEKASPTEASEVGAEMIVGESTAISPNPFGPSDDAADTIPYETSREAPAPYASPRQPASGKVSPGVNSRPAHTPTGMARASLSGPYHKTSPGINANGSRGAMPSNMAHSHPSLRTSVSAPSRPALTPTKLPLIAPGPLPGSTGKPSITPNGTPRLAGAYASVGQAARPSVTPTSAPRPSAAPSADEMDTPAAQIPAVTPTSIPTGPIYAALSQTPAEPAPEPVPLAQPSARNARPGRMRQRDTDDPNDLYTATPTMQIRTARRVSLEDVAPDKLLGPAGDVDDRLLKSAGVPRSSRLLGLVLLLFLLLGGSSFAVYYAMAQKVPNPPHIHTAHAAQAGLARGLVEFEGANSALVLADASQPPSLLLVNGKPPKAPKPAPSPAPKAAPKVETPAPKPAPTPAPEPPKPPTAPPKIKIIPR